MSYDYDKISYELGPYERQEIEHALSKVSGAFCWLYSFRAEGKSSVSGYILAFYSLRDELSREVWLWPLKRDQHREPNITHIVVDPFSGAECGLVGGGCYFIGKAAIKALRGRVWKGKVVLLPRKTMDR